MRVGLDQTGLPQTGYRSAVTLDCRIVRLCDHSILRSVMVNSTHPTVPESDPAAPVPDSVTGASEDESAVDLSHLPEEHRAPVRRLYACVERAVATIQTLRSQNERLRERVAELEAKPTFPEDESVLALEAEPDVLRDRISGFIDAIDTYLDAVEETPTGDEPGEDRPDSPSTP